MALQLTANDCEGRVFNVSETGAFLSTTIKNMWLDFGGSDSPIPLHNVKGNVLEKVIEFVEHQVAQPDDADWRKNFCEKNWDMIYDLVNAANYLDLRCLMDSGCDAIAARLNGKTPDQIRQFFGIKENLTPEEQAELAKKHSWCSA